jgi:hypothetical protein
MYAKPVLDRICGVDGKNVSFDAVMQRSIRLISDPQGGTKGKGHLAPLAQKVDDMPAKPTRSNAQRTTRVTGVEVDAQDRFEGDSAHGLALFSSLRLSARIVAHPMPYRLSANTDRLSERLAKSVNVSAPKLTKSVEPSQEMSHNQAT